MTKIKSEDSRRALKENGYKVIRAYIKSENKDKLMKAKKVLQLSNIDLVLDLIIKKSVNAKGGLKK